LVVLVVLVVVVAAASDPHISCSVGGLAAEEINNRLMAESDVRDAKLCRNEPVN
jgi:hypothetical protein